jgi:ribonucleoside-diphosphate reductase alpha chain
MQHVDRVVSRGFTRNRFKVSADVVVHANGNGAAHANGNGHAAISVSSSVIAAVDDRLDCIRQARLKGYEGDACGECGNFTLVRNGTCLKCDNCGATSGCS